MQFGLERRFGEKRKALIKIQYHGYPQAMLQQERVERERFYEDASQGVAHNQCDGNGVGHGGGGILIPSDDSASPLAEEGT